MKKTLRILFAAALCLLAAERECPAQDYVPTPVTISKDKVKQNGRLYYAHIVLERQTLFSIAKAYGVTVDEIYAANENINLKENGLKTNSIILVPATGTPGQDPAGSGSGEEENDGKDSGAESGAARSDAGSGAVDSGVTPPQNPTVTPEDSSRGASGKGGRKSVRKAAKSDKGKIDYFIHTVKWYEDLDSICEKYGVSPAIIMDFNGLTSKKLKARQQLKIPTNPEDYDIIPSEGGDEKSGLVYPGQNPKQEAPDDSGREPADSSSVAPADSALVSPEEDIRFQSFKNRNTVSASLLLPFNAADTLGANVLSMDFYSGVLLAARDLASDGIEVDLNVFDTYGDKIPTDEKSLASSDFIIGLLSSNGFTTLMDSVPDLTYVISPLDYRTEPLTISNGSFIQCSNSVTAQYEDLALWISEDLQPEDKVVVIYEGNMAGQALKEQLEQILEKYDYEWSSFSYTILQGREVTEKLSSLFSEDGMNRVLVASENEAFVNDVVRNLNLLIHNQYAITLYGGSKIRSFENVDVENLHNTNFHSSLSFYIDYDNLRVRQFLMQYRALYNTEPSQTAFQGYDTMYYFATMLHLYGVYMGNGITTSTTSMLMSDFRFERAGKGLTRTAVRRIVYEPNYAVSYLQ